MTEPPYKSFKLNYKQIHRRFNYLTKTGMYDTLDILCPSIQQLHLKLQKDLNYAHDFIETDFIRQQIRKTKQILDQYCSETPI